jgi:membrane protease YdiL (CAAX protease family)
MAAFVALAAFGTQQDWPATLALLLAWPLAGIPTLVAILLYEGYRRNRRWSLEGVVLFRAPLPLRQYLWLVPVLLIWSALASSLFLPLGELLRQWLLSGWPTWLLASAVAQNLHHYPLAVHWAVVLLSLVLNIVVPVIEEAYFRGYLLPRLAHWGKWAPLANVLLFSLYHFWTPWDTVGRVLTLLPVVYVVWWKRNIYIGIWMHVLLNSLGTLGLLALVLSRA